jgi:sigma-B regulation protein RsbQ
LSVLEKLHVEIRGTGNPLLLFVPGWGCDRTVWSRLTPLLEGRFRVAAFDPRGFGESEETLTEPDGWSLSVTCEDITVVLGTLGAPRAVVVGSSLGGMAALRLASAPPPGLAGVVAIGASPCPTRRPDFPHGFTPEMAEGVLAGLREDFVKTCETLAPGYWFPGRLEADKDEEKALLLAMVRRVRRPRAYVEILERSLGEDIRPPLGAIALPVLLVHGGEDVAAPPEVGEYTRSRVPRSKLVIVEGTGHLPHLTAPAAVAREILDFAAGLSTGSPGAT